MVPSARTTGSGSVLLKKSALPKIERRRMKQNPDRFPHHEQSLQKIITTTIFSTLAMLCSFKTLHKQGLINESGTSFSKTCLLLGSHFSLLSYHHINRLRQISSWCNTIDISRIMSRVNLAQFITFLIDDKSIITVFHLSWNKKFSRHSAHIMTWLNPVSFPENLNHYNYNTKMEKKERGKKKEVNNV